MSPAEIKGASILLAEDNDINALLACTVLEQSGARVAHVRNGAEAIAPGGSELAQGTARVSTSCSRISTCPTSTGWKRRAALGRFIRPIVALPPTLSPRMATSILGRDDYLAKPFEKAALAAARTHREVVRFPQTVT